MARFVRAILCFSLPFLLSGCGNSPPTLMTDPETVQKLEELAKQKTPGEK